MSSSMRGYYGYTESEFVALTPASLQLLIDSRPDIHHIQKSLILIAHRGVKERVAQRDRLVRGMDRMQASMREWYERDPELGFIPASDDAAWDHRLLYPETYEPSTNPEAGNPGYGFRSPMPFPGKSSVDPDGDSPVAVTAPELAASPPPVSAKTYATALTAGPCGIGKKPVPPAHFLYDGDPEETANS